MPEYEVVNDDQGEEYSCCDSGCCEECHPGCYDDEEEDMPSRNWWRGPFDGDAIEGEYIRTTRTIGVEYERGSSYPSAGHENYDLRLDPAVGIGSDHCGIEVRTPPASGQAADRFTRDTLVTLIEAGFPTGNDSGLHVHVHFPEGYSDEAPDFYNYETGRYEPNPRYNGSSSNTAMARFLALWASIEHIAFRFCPGRRSCSWSAQQVRGRSARLEHVNRFLDNARNGTSPRRSAGRYYAANTNQSGYQTIEFRGHYSTDEVEHVMAWVAFVQGVVDLSQSISYIGIQRIAEASTHDERANLLMRFGRRHGVWTDTAYAAIRRELGLSPARVRRAA